MWAAVEGELRAVDISCMACSAILAGSTENCAVLTGVVVGMAQGCCVDGFELRFPTATIGGRKELCSSRVYLYIGMHLPWGPA